MTYRQLLAAIAQAEELQRKEHGLQFTIREFGGADSLWSSVDRQRMSDALAATSAALDTEI